MPRAKDPHSPDNEARVDVSAEQPLRPRNVAFSVLLRGALPPTLVVGALASVVVGAVNGPRAGVSGLVGLAIVVGFFASGLLVVSRVVVDTSNPLLFMAVAMAVYLAQVLLLLGILVLASQVTAFDSRAAGVVMLAVVVAWQVAQVVAWRRARVPIYDDVALPPTPGASAPSSTSQT